MRTTVKQITKLLVASLLSSGACTNAAGLAAPECIAPAKPGGGFDLTCKLIQLDAGEYWLQLPQEKLWVF